MKNLTSNQERLLSKSEKALLNIFSSLSIEEKPPVKEEKSPNEEKQILKVDFKNSFSESLKMMNLENYSISLFKTITNIEKRVNKKTAIKYLEGYLEYNNISMEELFIKSNDSEPLAAVYN